MEADHFAGGSAIFDGLAMGALTAAARAASAAQNGAVAVS
jgi:hypothetical protein